MNLRTIVKKVIATGAISILVEYLPPDSFLSLFRMIEQDEIIGDLDAKQGHLIFQNESNLPVSFFINPDGNLMVNGDSSEISKYSIDDNGHVIYTM